MAKNLVTTTYMDVTELTSMIACDKDYYDRVMSSSSSEDPTSGKPKDYALYLVNEGSTEGENRLTDIYYGGRKWTDLVILTYGPEGYIDYNGNILPDVTDWADEKLYLVIYDDGAAGSDKFSFNLYIKYDGEVIPIASFSAKEIIADRNKGIVQFIWYDDSWTNIPMTSDTPITSGRYLLHQNVAAQSVYNPEGEGSLSLNRKEGTVVGTNSVAVGTDGTSSGNSSTAEGYSTSATGNYSHSEGYMTTATGISSHAEGDNNVASGDYSHSEGSNTLASGDNSHSEGDHSKATDDSAHSEGHYTVASGKGSHAEGGYSNPEQDPHSYDNCGTTASGTSSHAEGFRTLASGDYSHTEGYHTTASGVSSHSEGSSGTTASGNSSHAEGTGTQSSGGSSHAEGTGTNSSGSSSHAEGNSTFSYGNNSHSEGSGSKSYGSSSHAEGINTVAGKSTDSVVSAVAAHAEGLSTVASGQGSHSEGTDTTATGNFSHSEGSGNSSTGQSSHAEGSGNTASGVSSHAEGLGTTSSGQASHAEGVGTVSQGSGQHVQGKYNISDSTSLDIIGNGVDTDHRSNAYTLSSAGDAWYAGDVYVGSTSGTNKDAGSLKLATVRESGSTLSFTMNPSTFVLTAVLTSVDDTVLSTQTVDLPLEEFVIDGSYDSENKTLILTLKSGTEIEIDISDIISGLVNEDDFEAYQQEVASALDEKVDVTDYTQDMEDIQDQIDSKVSQTDYDNDMSELDQRLDDMQEQIDNPSLSVTLTGQEVADLDGAKEDIPLDNLIISIEPEQDLNGYDRPWAGGQGKNIIDQLDVVLSSDRSVVINLSNLEQGQYVLSFDVGDYLGIYEVDFEWVDGQVNKMITVNANPLYGWQGRQSFNFTVDDHIETMTVEVSSSADPSYYINIENIMVESGTTATEYEPYENECPITGHTSSNVYVGDSSDHPVDTYNIDWEDEAGTVYHGTLNVTTGELTVDYAEIPSYSGETLPGKWMSSLDEYTEGGTPTEGAQVIYELDTPITYQLDPTQVNTLIGSDSVIWTDTGSVEEVVYEVDLKSYIDSHGGSSVDPISTSVIEDILDGTYPS